MNWQAGIAAVVGLALLAACNEKPMSKSATDEAAARDACRSAAEAALARPEGRGLVGAADYNKYVDQCMRSKGY